MSFFKDLTDRGIIEAKSHEELDKLLDSEKLRFYCGYDPSAKSLQLGNLFSIITCMRFQRAGHIPYILVGGATGMIGDPSGRSSERNLLDMETLDGNIEAIKNQLSRFLNFSEGDNKATLVNNRDWWSKLSFLDVLRDIGKRFRVSEMLSKDSVKSRINSDSGISFTEFSYQILQGYDFAYLNKTYGVNLQIGGSDQWGNMTAGTDLTRKMNQSQVFCMTTPLVTDANGKKFGKSEGNAIFLDGDMTSPYKMYQFLLNSDDAIVVNLLKFYTFLSMDEIKALEAKMQSEPHLRAAQKTLAEEVVKLVHGQEGLDAALRATQFFFGAEITKISDKEVSSIFEDVPSVSLDKSLLSDGIDIGDLLVQTPLFPSKKEARRSLEQKGVSLNNGKIDDISMKITREHLVSETSLILRKGKKNYCVVRFE